MKVTWLARARARAARQAAIDFIAQDDPLAALSQIDEIEQQVDLLASQPRMGRPGRVKGTREIVIGRTSFILVYRIDPKAERLEVLHFLHGAQQWPSGDST